MRASWVAILWVGGILVLGSACGDDTTGEDAGPVPDGMVPGGDGGVRVAPPEIPWLAEGAPPVELTPCPPGWREVTGGVVTECDPYPAEGAAECGAGEAHFVGEAGCRAVGDACPAGDYAEGLPTDGSVIYVKAGADAGGDGSLGAPYPGLDQVNWISVSAGRTVALAGGSYEGILPLKAGAQVVGACARDTILTGRAGTVNPVVSVTNAGDPAVVRNVTIADAPQWGATLAEGRSLVLRGVVVEGAEGGGVTASGPGTSLTLTDVVIRDTRPRSDNATGGLGIQAVRGAEVVAEGLVVAGNRSVGINGLDEGTTVTVTDAVIRGTLPQTSDGRFGRGLALARGVHFEGARILVTGNHSTGVHASVDGTTVALEDAIIRDTQPRPSNGQLGRGLEVLGNTTFDGTRLVIAENHDAALVAGNEGTRVTLTDVVIRDTQPQASDDANGRAVGVQLGATFEALRLLAVDHRHSGIFASGEGTRVTLTDVAILRTDSELRDGTGGRAVSVQDGVSLSASRLLARDSRESAVVVIGSTTTATLSDVVLRDTTSREVDQIAGHGISIEEGAHLVGERIEVRGAQQVGVSTSRSVAEFTDLSVTNVTSAACSTTTCVESPYGYGVAALSATLTVTGFEVRESAICGLMLAPATRSTVPSEVDLEAGVISGAAIGACIQVSGYDLDRLTNDVQYVDNGTSLDATMLPVPGGVDEVGL